MEYIKVSGGKSLFGSIDVQGSKNAVLPALAATILNEGETVLHNCPDISDVKITLDIRNFDFLTKTGAMYKIEFTDSEPGSGPSIAPSTPTYQPGTIPGDTTASAKPTVEPTPSTVPSVKPSAGQGSTGENVDTGDSSDYILTALVAVFVMSVAVFALTTMKKKEN